MNDIVFSAVLIGLIAVIVLSMGYSVTHFIKEDPDIAVIRITVILGIIIIIGATIGLVEVIADRLNNNNEIIKSGEYTGLKLFDNDSDSVIVEITATIDDQQVKRTSKYTLKGRDFSNSEINETNKALNKLVINMLEIRQAEVDSIRKLYGTKDNAENCDLITKNNNVYRLCKVD